VSAKKSQKQTKKKRRPFVFCSTADRSYVIDVAVVITVIYNDLLWLSSGWLRHFRNLTTAACTNNRLRGDLIPAKFTKDRSRRRTRLLRLS